MTKANPLKAKVDQLTGQIKNLNTENSNLKSQLDALKASSTLSPEQLEALLNNAALADDNEALRVELKVSQEQVKELEKALKEAAAKTPAADKKPEPAKKEGISNATFKVADKTYSFAMPAVLFEGNKITAKDVLGSKELQEKLVEMGSGFIKEA